MFPRKCEQGLHLAADAGVVYRHDGSRALRQGLFDKGFVEVERVRPDVYEHRRGATEHEGVGRGDEGVGGHDDFVALLDVEKQGWQAQPGQFKVMIGSASDDIRLSGKFTLIGG